MTRSTKVRFALVLITAITVPGFTNYVLVQNGFETLGSIVWALGYGIGVLVLWYVWLRPLDLTGPEGNISHEVNDPVTDAGADQPRRVDGDTVRRGSTPRDRDVGPRETSNREHQFDPRDGS